MPHDKCSNEEEISNSETADRSFPLRFVIRDVVIRKFGMSDVARYLDPLTVEQLSHLRPAARRGIVDGLAAGPHRGRFTGPTADFRQHRPYVPGDEPRRIDWRVLARTDRPFVRQHDAQTNLRCVLLLDASGSMAYADKALFAARLTAALTHLLTTAGEAVGVATTAGDWLPPRTGPAQLSRVVDLLDRVRPHGPTDWPAVAGRLVTRLGRRAVVVVLSDLMSPMPVIRDGLARLRSARHDVTVLRLLHPDERTFPFRTGLRLRGLEGERPVALDPATARSAYLANFARHERQLMATCRTLGVRLHAADTTDGAVNAVTRLMQAGR
jgi:uncharacterized protein (DUF58 family)